MSAPASPEYTITGSLKCLYQPVSSVHRWQRPWIGSAYSLGAARVLTSQSWPIALGDRLSLLRSDAHGGNRIVVLITFKPMLCWPRALLFTSHASKVLTLLVARGERSHWVTFVKLHTLRWWLAPPKFKHRVWLSTVVTTCSSRESVNRRRVPRVSGPHSCRPRRWATQPCTWWQHRCLPEALRLSSHTLVVVGLRLS